MFVQTHIAPSCLEMKLSAAVELSRNELTLICLRRQSFPSLNAITQHAHIATCKLNQTTSGDSPLTPRSR